MQDFSPQLQSKTWVEPGNEATPSLAN